MVMVLCCQIVLLAGPLQVSGDEMAALTEDVSKRTAQTKTYQLSDGGYAAVMYAEPVHYQNENGEWETIDNSLKSVALKANAEETTIATNATMLDKVGAVVGLVETKAYLQNVNNSFKVSLPQEMSKENPVFVESGDHAISFTLLDDVNVTAENLTATSEQQELAKYQQNMATATAEEQAQLSMNETMRVPHQTAELKYAGVRPAVDVSYEVTGQSLKESIIFNEMPQQEATFTYRLEYEDLTPALQENGAVHFYAVDAAEGDEPVFIIQSPYMFDELDDISTNIAVTLTPTATGCLYTMAPDMAWLQDSARVYPVTLDPSVYTTQSTSWVQDTYVYAEDPTSNFGTVNRMYVGSKYVGSKGYEFRTYIRFTNLPSVPSEAYIRYAAIDLVHYNNSSYQSADNNTFDIYDAGSNNWNANTITWNSQKNYTFGVLVASYVSDKDDSDGEERVVITTLVRDWYDNPSNNGLVIKPHAVDNTKTNRTCYASVNHSTTSSRPAVVVDYYEGDPTQGIDSNAVYYIRNVSTGLYLQAGTEEKEPLTQNYYHSSRASKLKWQVKYLGGGCYGFVPQNNTGFRLGVNGSVDAENRDVEVYIPTRSRGQTFRIYKNTDSLNSYRIQPLCISNNRVISLATPYTRNATTKVVLRTWSTSLHEGRWIFTKTPATEKANAFGGVFYKPSDALNHEGERLFTNGFNQLGYDSVAYIGRNEATYCAAMQETDIMYVLAHGSPETIDFENFMLVCSDYYEQFPEFDDREKVYLQPLDLSGVKLAILYACETAAPDLSGDGKNICEVLVEMGVDCVIGWEEQLYVGEKDIQWMEKFLQKTNAGKTIATAVREINKEFEEDLFMYEAKVHGSGNFTL